jgi:hypothetical protein
MGMAWLVVGQVFPALAQAPVAPGPAPVVLLALDEVSAYGSVRLGVEDYSELKDASEESFFLAAKGGKTDLKIQVQGCAETIIPLNLTTGRKHLLTLARMENPDPKTRAQHPKVLRHELILLENLPEPRGSAQVAALYLRGSPPSVEGKLFHGMAEPRNLVLSKGKVVSLGQGKTGMEIGGRQLIFCNPSSDPLVYLFVLVEEEGQLRSIKAVF